MFLRDFNSAVVWMPTWWCKPQISWCPWASRCLFPSIYPRRRGRCWLRCQPSDSECLRSCHLWDTETEWHWRRRKRESGSDRQKKKGEEKKGNQQISWSFIFCTVLWWQYLISVSCESACLPASQSPESQMSHISGPLSLLVMHCGGNMHTPTHTIQLYGFHRVVWLDTGYSWCLSGDGNQSYTAAHDNVY